MATKRKYYNNKFWFSDIYLSRQFIMLLRMFSRDSHVRVWYVCPICMSETMLPQHRLLAVISGEADIVPFPCFVTVSVACCI